MNPLQRRLKVLDPYLLELLNDCIGEVQLLLQRYAENFPTYTDHSIDHTMQVFKIASEMMTPSEINNLNAEEIYVLSAACILHDVGMCIPENVLEENFESDRYKKYRNSQPKEKNKENLIREIHHELSYDFIIVNQELLKIPNNQFAEAIALVAMGHRKVQLDDTDLYKSKHFLKDGREFVCLPYLASILRLADELDITNIRTPKLLTKYYMPNNETSIREWEKHIATTQINYTEDKVIFHVNCSDQNNLAALEDQFEKIQDAANYSQKIIRNIANTDDRVFKLTVNKVEPKYNYVEFDPKGIKFSFNVNNVVNTFIGKDLYKNDLTAIREVLQNAIDSCRYKLSLGTSNYSPTVSVNMENDSIVIVDNGLGMDEFIIENFFGRLGSSFYKEEEVKSNYDAIGQFGVGVFSYFLLGKYIDIETKTSKSSTLKFRIDKDPKSYFHFYNETFRTEPGTTITLHLNEDVKNRYSKSDYFEYVKNQFRYVEFPIHINIDSEVIKIANETPHCAKINDVRHKIKVQHLDKIDALEVISVEISTSEFEGECSLVIPKLDSNLNILSIGNWFDYSSFDQTGRAKLSSVDLYQKGVFVSAYSCDMLRYSFGQINIKQSIPININRNEFKNSLDVDVILNKFAVSLLKEIFEGVKKICENGDDKVKHSRAILALYLDGSSFRRFNELKDDLTNLIRDNIWLKVFDSGQVKCLSIAEIVDNYGSIILLPEDEFEIDRVKKISIPCVIVEESRRRYKNGILSIFVRLFDCEECVYFLNNFAYQQITIDNKIDWQEHEDILLLKQISGYEVSNVLKFSDGCKKIATTFRLFKPQSKLMSQYLGELQVNVNHPFVKELLLKLKNTESNSNFKRVIREAFEIIMLITHGRDDVSKQIRQLNKIIKPENSEGINYVFRKKDFLIQNMDQEGD